MATAVHKTFVSGASAKRFFPRVVDKRNVAVRADKYYEIHMPAWNFQIGKYLIGAP